MQWQPKLCTVMLAISAVGTLGAPLLSFVLLVDCLTRRCGLLVV